METPTINKASRVSTSYSSAGTVAAPDANEVIANAMNTMYGGDLAQQINESLVRNFEERAAHALPAGTFVGWPGERKMQKVPEPLQPPKRKWTMRIVQVFIVDTNINIPLDKRVLYRSGELTTDLTDQELFFEAWDSKLLAAHNELRKATLNKEATTKAGKDVFLEPARIGQLTMTVVDVAKF